MKSKLKSIKAYEDTLGEVRKIVSENSRLTIQGFYDDAAKEKIKTTYNEQNAGQIAGRSDNSEAAGS